MIIETKPWAAAGGGMMARRVVLRKVEGYHPYVTHIQTEDERGKRSFYSGHYFATLQEALDDFWERNV